MGFHDEVMRTFAQRLKAARKAKGYATAKDFSDELGVEPGTYRYWERGQASPSLTMLTRICRLLEVEPNDLLVLAKRRDPPQTNSDRGCSAA